MIMCAFVMRVSNHRERIMNMWRVKGIYGNGLSIGIGREQLEMEKLEIPKQ